MLHSAMAKVISASGLPLAVVVNGQRINTGANGNLVMGPATSNRKRTNSAVSTGMPVPTPQFSALDNLILQLDALYDLLPNQADWEAYAISIFGQWSICANCTVILSGKKLFRQLNMARFLSGLALVTVPPSGAAGPNAGPINLLLGTALGGPPYVVEFVSAQNFDGCLFIAQQGKALANPSWIWDSSQLNVPQVAGTLFGFVVDLYNNYLAEHSGVPAAFFLMQACASGPAGEPGQPSVIRVDVFL